MNLELVLGWTAAGVATLLGIPQIVRLIRTRNTDGLSLVLWQAMIAINTGWLVHGFRIGAVNMVVPNVIGLGTTITILLLVIRARGLRPVPVIAPGVAAAIALMAIDHLLGAAAFGVAAAVPAVIANAGQSVSLVRSPRITGVSPVFLAGQTVNQALWFSWSLIVVDHGTMITAPVTGVVALFNLVWWVLRQFGLRALFVRPEPVGLVVEESPQVSCES